MRGGSGGDGGPEDAHLPCTASSGVLMERNWLEVAFPNFLLSPFMGDRGSPYEGPDPRYWELHQLPTPPKSLLPCLPPPGQNWAAGNLAPIWLKVGWGWANRAFSGLGDGLPEPAGLAQRHRGGGFLGQPQSQLRGPSLLSHRCERFKVKSGVAPGGWGSKAQGPLRPEGGTRDPLRPEGGTLLRLRHPLEPRGSLKYPHQTWFSDLKQPVSQLEKDLEVPNDHKLNKSQEGDSH